MGIEPTIRVLQTRALPLGYVAVAFGSLPNVRTSEDISALRGVIGPRSVAMRDSEGAPSTGGGGGAREE